MILAILLAAQVVGVLEFRDKVPAEQRIDAAYLSDQVRTAVKETLPQAKVITRENMLVLLQSGGKKVEECEGACEVDTGRRIGADLVVSGELLRFGTQYKLNMKLHDTRSGELIAGSVASGATADELDRALRPAVEKLLASLRSAAAQDELSDQRAAARETPAPSPVRFAASLHAMAGYGYGYKTTDLLGVQNQASFTFGGGLDLGARVSNLVSVAAFGEVLDLTQNLMVLVMGGALVRLHASPDLAIAAGGGVARLGDTATGFGLLAEADYRLSGRVWLHAQFAWAQGAASSGTGGVAGLADQPAPYCLSGGLGIALVY